MADTIHKKKKNWPHIDSIFMGGDKYAEGYDRIFRNKAKKKRVKRRNEKRNGVQQK